MNKKGIALAVVLVVTAVLSVIIISLFAQAMHERNLVNRHVNTVRAFWLAEAGVSDAHVNFRDFIRNRPDSISGNIVENQGCPPGADCSYQVESDDDHDCVGIDDVYPGFDKKEIGIEIEIEYVFNNSSPPGDGKLALNNSEPELSDELYASIKDKNEGDVSDELSEIDDNYYVIIYRTDGGVADCKIEDDGIGKAVYKVNSVNADNDYFTYGVSNLSTEGSFEFEEGDVEVKIVFVRPDSMGYIFNDPEDPPDDGALSLKDDIEEKHNELYVSTKDKNGNDIINKLLAINGQYYAVIINDDGVGKLIYEVEAVESGSDYFTYEVSRFSSEGSFDEEDEVKLAFVHQDLITGLMEVSYRKYYKIVSTGKVELAGGGEIEEEITVFLKVGIPSPLNFPYAIESTGDIIIQGQAYTIEPEGSKKTYSELNFFELFGATKAEIKNNADYLYDETDNFTGDGVEVTGLTWVEVSAGEQLTIAGNFEGEGVLIVNGDCRITGTESFEGVIYVIGELQVSGTASVTGSVLAESGLDIDTTISGNISLTHDQDVIRNALSDSLTFIGKTIISWQKK